MTDAYKMPASAGTPAGLGASVLALLVVPYRAIIRRRAERQANRRRHPGPVDPEQLPDWIKRDLGL